jgi:hypothetical protein
VGPAIAEAAPGASEAVAAPAFTVKNAPVEHSFAAAAQSMGVDAATTAILAQAFHGELNFARDLRAGDRVSAVFDKGNTGGAPSAPLAVRIARGTVTYSCTKRFRASLFIIQKMARAPRRPSSDTR